MDKYKIKFAHLSDLHITSYRNLLKPMIDYINKESVDFVVITGDLVHEPRKDLFDIAISNLNSIRHKVIVVPGDYDSGGVWKESFGDFYKSINIGDYCLDFLDTSFMKHRYAVGWSDVLKDESPEQYEWLKDKLKDDRYHLIFSHHPAKVMLDEKTNICDGNELLGNNVRANYCGHLHNPTRIHFRYDRPKSSFEFGFVNVTMKFHGNSCYALVLVKDTDEIANIPRIVSLKTTAW